MLRLSSTRWNQLMFGILLLGTFWISVTRVRPVVETSMLAPATTQREPAPQPEYPAPPFALTALDGSTVNLADQRGKVVLINLWATWCPPCRAEMPLIQTAYESYAAQGFTVLAVNQREDRDTVNAFMQQHELTFPALLDADGAVSQLYRSTVYPSSFIIDRRGVVRVLYRGPLPRSVLVGTIEQLLAEGE